jgi:hypothetical protein
MWPDRLALIGASHDRIVGVDAEVVRPEPYQALDEANVCRDGGLVVNLGLAEKVLSHRCFWLRVRRSGGGRFGFGGLLHPGRCIVHDELRGL